MFFGSARRTFSPTPTPLPKACFGSAQNPSTIRLRRTVPLPIAPRGGGANDGGLFGEAALEDMLSLLAPSGFIWVRWPKKASKVPTDITEDTIRDVCLPIGLVDVKVCAVDSTWSGLKLMKRKSSNSRIAIRSVRVT